MIFKVFNMEKKTQNLLLLGIAGIGIYYFLKNKNASVVPTTTADLPSPIEQIKTPVEPIYTPPIFEERDPINKEPIYNNLRIDTAPVFEEKKPIYQPESYYDNNDEYSGSISDFANNISFLDMLYEKDTPVEYDFEQKRK
jgi:hypothetical protein